MRRGGALGRSAWHTTMRGVAAPGLGLHSSRQCMPCVILSAHRFASDNAGHAQRVRGAAADIAFRADHPTHGADDAHLPSTHVEEEGAFDAEEFDELEAASQEVHDLCYAMIAYLRRADPDGTTELFQRRTKRAFREPKPERQRRMLHGHHDRTLESKNLFASDKDFKEATQLFLQWGDKLLLLLNKPLLDRLIASAGKSYRDNRSDGIHKYKRPIERATWRTFPHRWYKHAPFEVQQLRADIPESAVLNTRFYRDHCTLRYLFSLIEPQHAYRGALEKRMFELTSSYDPHSRPPPQP